MSCAVFDLIGKGVRTHSIMCLSYNILYQDIYNTAVERTHCHTPQHTRIPYISPVRDIMITYLHQWKLYVHELYLAIILDQ
jgi:hypothetical protein